MSHPPFTYNDTADTEAVAKELGQFYALNLGNMGVERVPLPFCTIEFEDEFGEACEDVQCDTYVIVTKRDLDAIRLQDAAAAMEIVKHLEWAWELGLEAKASEIRKALGIVPK